MYDKSSAEPCWTSNDNAAGIPDNPNTRSVNMRDQIAEIRVVPVPSFANADEAIESLRSAKARRGRTPDKYEIQLRFSSGAKIDAQFHDGLSAIEFLEQYRSGNWTPAGPAGA